MIHYIVSPQKAGERLDQFVTDELPKLSRASVQKLCRSAKITVNTKPAKPGHKLQPGDSIAVAYDPAETVSLSQPDLTIIYEDADCIVVDKPAGLLTHSKGAFSPEATVASWLNQKLDKNVWSLEKSEDSRLGIIHRLDRATSGVIIMAKNPNSLKWLQKQFATRKVKKTYIAIVEGHVNPPAAIIDMPIERNPKKPQTFRSGSNGKPAVTHYQVLREKDGFSQLELKPQTGRTHQLRVHLKQIGHPIVGDTLYGGATADRLFLHAESLEITLPSRVRQLFCSPLPKAFKDFLK